MIQDRVTVGPGTPGSLRTSAGPLVYRLWTRPCSIVQTQASRKRLRSYRTLLWALQAVVLLLWLIATINEANLMLATRRRQYRFPCARSSSLL